MAENLSNCNHLTRLQEEMNRFEEEIGVGFKNNFSNGLFLMPSGFPMLLPTPPIFFSSLPVFIPQQVQKNFIKKDCNNKNMIILKNDFLEEQQGHIKEESSPVISATAQLYNHLTPMVLKKPPPAEFTEQKVKNTVKNKIKCLKKNNCKIKKNKIVTKKKIENSSSNNNNNNDINTIEEKKMVRKAGAQIWEDKSLLDWEDDDFRLFCGDLGNDVTDELLKWTFSKYPSFMKAKVIRDKRTNKSKGYGFVSFKDAQDYVNAMKEINGRYVGSRPIKLRKSTWRSRNIEIVKNKEKERKYFLFKS